MGRKVNISMTAADDAWGPGGYAPDEDEIEQVHANYTEAAYEVANRWWSGDDDEIEIDITFEDTNLRNVCFIEVDGKPIEGDEESFLGEVWDTFCQN